MSKNLQTKQKGQILAVKDLPTLPGVLHKVTALVSDPDSSIDQISKAISKDQVLSAKVLKMVNSPIYGFPGRIGSIQHALVLLGFNVIKGIIISTSVFDVMNENMKGLWEHSLGCALASAAIARALECKDPEEYAVAGLLHDIGKVVAVVQLPESRAAIDALVKDKDLAYRQAENEVLGFAHDRINMWLSNHWNLPANLKEGLAYHHRPMSATLYPKIAQVVHVGNFLTRVFEVGNGGDDQVSPLDEGVLEALDLSPQLLHKVMAELEHELVDLL
ncbi:MAG: HDOD domain-containing protein [Desulfomicrobium sp.]|jgi:HD-like signal output (HDOD) protein|nr:HDOD domain-containing protein [Desulfomicrobium sp.]NLV96318.1 HDOD domain-containing protein [Desulfovibrionales bacterium]